MEELIEELLSQIAEGLSGMGDVIDVDNIMDNASDSLHDLMDNLSESGVDLTDENRQLIVDQIMEAVGGDPNLIADNLAALADNGFDWPANDAFPDTTDVDLGAAAGNGGEISFGSAGCWDECIASVQDAGKRMTCGYHA